MTKKTSVFAVLVMLAMSRGMWGQSIKVTSPSPGVAWCIGSSVMITWSSMGVTGPLSIKLRPANQPPSSPPVLDIAASTVNSGSFSWKIPASLAPGNYCVRVRTVSISPLIYDDSASFTVKSCPGGTQVVVLPPQPTVAPGNMFSVRQTMTIHAPKGGDVWKPMADYPITWEAVRNKYPASAYYFNVKLIAVNNPAFTPLMLKQNCWTYAKQTADSNIYNFTWKFLGSMNIPSGKYKLTVQSVSIPEFKCETGAITVQNTVSGNTGFIGEDEHDLIIEDVYYDAAKKSMWARVKNQGFSPYSGPLAITYHFTLGSITYKTPACQNNMNGEAKFTAITLNKYQANNYLLCKWTCFEKRPGDFIPITGPVNYDVYLSATGKPASSKTGTICKSKASDIIVDNQFLLRGSGDPATLFAFQQESLSPSSFHWVSDTVFEAKVEVQVWNWGCQGKQFEVKLHMDGNYLNGKNEATLGSISLGPGQQTYLVSGPVKFSIPKDGQYHKMLLVAYQGESNDEGYPDAYKNNFILTHVQLKQR